MRACREIKALVVVGISSEICGHRGYRNKFSSLAVKRYRSAEPCFPCFSEYYLKVVRNGAGIAESVSGMLEFPVAVAFVGYDRVTLSQAHPFAEGYGIVFVRPFGGFF